VKNKTSVALATVAARPGASPLLGLESRPERLLRFPRVKERCGELSHSTIYDLMAKGEFPKPVSLSGGRAVAWKESSIDAWIASRTESQLDMDIEKAG
jgi:prophage regulatory protein